MQTTVNFPIELLTWVPGLQENANLTTHAKEKEKHPDNFMLYAQFKIHLRSAAFVLSGLSEKGEVSSPVSLPWLVAAGGGGPCTFEEFGRDCLPSLKCDKLKCIARAHLLNRFSTHCAVSVL